jgi:6-phosphofructokinase 1
MSSASASLSLQNQYFSVLNKLIPKDLVVEDLSKGIRQFPLPFIRSDQVTDDDRVLLQSGYVKASELRSEYAFEVAGQRDLLFYNPKETIVGIVTCGGLAAGLNDVVRSISYTCFKYGVKKVYGLLLD